MTTTTEHRVASREEWLAERRALLALEKELNRTRDQLAERRRELPWVLVDGDYRFEGEDGPATLRDLFGGRGQLLVYHFMFGPDWDEGCPSCSFWADGFANVGVHLEHRDVRLVCVSRAPLDKLLAYRARMGWSFPWYSSFGSDFNLDFHVSFPPELPRPTEYNFSNIDPPEDELPGLSAFIATDDGVFHTYSTYSRGIDPINVAYQLLDLAPRGRDEDGLEFPAAWLHRHDDYPD
jgi:predicted dithiol-disulfide oxidoreductase (DUF899 family)